VQRNSCQEGEKEQNLSSDCEDVDLPLESVSHN
jgi:hypothetical protein